MQHECKITVLETKCFADYQQQYLANPASGPRPFFKPGVFDWAGLILISFVLPAVISLALCKYLKKIGWIKEGDLTL